MRTLENTFIQRRAARETTSVSYTGRILTHFSYIRMGHVLITVNMEPKVVGVSYFVTQSQVDGKGWYHAD